MTFRALLVTTMRWPFAARLAGAFASQGAHVEALCPPGHVLASSRHVSRLFAFHPLFPRLAEAVALSRPDLIVPCDDPAAQLLARFARKSGPGTAGLLAYSLGDAKVLARLTARNNFLAEAGKLGIRTAAAIPVASEADVDKALETLGAPVVMKTDHSWGGDGVVIAPDRQAALEAFRRLAHPSRLRDLARAMRRRETHYLARALSPERPEIGIQPFITGHPATSAIACWRGELVAANHFDVVVAQGTGPATVVAPVACSQMEQAARRIAKAFKLSGLFGLDYMRDIAGQAHLLEINPRATPTAHLALAADPCVALLTAAGGRGMARPAATAQSHIALFPQEWARDPASPWLDSAYHDVPMGDPGLMAACLAPHPGTPAFTQKSPEPAAKIRLGQT